MAKTQHHPGPGNVGKVGNLGKKPAMGLRSLKKTTMILGMKTNIYDFVIAKLAEAKGHWTEVAVGSKISKRTIEKIARKEIKNPGIQNIQALADYFNSLSN